MSAGRDGTGDPALVVSWARSAAPTPGLIGVLDEHERRRLRGIRQAADQARFVTAAALLRTVAGRAGGVHPAEVAIDRTCRTCDRSHGRPRLIGSHLSCSVSHSGDYVAVALADGGPVGLDLEDPTLPRGEWRRVARRITVPGEDLPLSWIHFLRSWTAKEAVLKLSGEGLAGSMDSIALAPGDGGGAESGMRWQGLSAPTGLGVVRVATGVIERAVMSVATHAPAVDLALEEWQGAALGTVAA